jgi:hypothetical protein
MVSVAIPGMASTPILGVAGCSAPPPSCPAILRNVALECVQLLRFPGQARALMSPEVAEIGVKMGEMKRLDPPRPATPEAGTESGRRPVRR